MSFSMFSLSGKGLQRVKEQSEKDFTLIINNKLIHVSKYLISFFSERIFKALSLNPTLKSYSITIHSNNDDKNDKKEEYLKDIKDLMEGKSIEIRKDNCQILAEIGKALGNEELIEACIKLVEGEEINNENCFKRIKIKEKCQIDFKEEEAFIAKHFSEYEKKDLETLEVDILDKIMKRKDLKINSEEELIDIIKSFKKEYRILMKDVDIRNIGDKYLEEYLNVIQEENLILEVWNIIRDKLLNNKNNNNNNKNRWIVKERKTFNFETGKEQNGILRELFNKCGGEDIHEKSQVNISSHPGVYTPYLGDLENIDYKCNWNQPNQWIQYDFYQKRVKLTNYTIYNTSSTKLIHWQVLGSNDGQKWDEIDKKDISPHDNKIVTYAVNTDKSYQYIRFLQTGKNSSNNYYFYYSGFEFFGDLEIPQLEE